MQYICKIKLMMKMKTLEIDNLLEFDKEHIWHPYTSMKEPLPVYLVESACGAVLKLESGEELIDGMSSWWCVIHGYNNPRLNRALKAQVDKMSHVMFGGITHKPAIELSKKLIKMAPMGLEKVFFADSGSVSVEVAIKMALQYSIASGRVRRNKIATISGGYHGDTWHAMSVCDPIGGMHSLYSGRLPIQYFVPRPSIGFGEEWCSDDFLPMIDLLENHHEELAAVIVEPIVQGAGGMWMYHPQYLKELSLLCKRYDILLIVDEIATGFGRTGKMFASEWSGVVPDIMCVGKAITGGYMSFAATLATAKVADVISSGEPSVIMHGPTFMANPLACAVANESLLMLDESSPLPRIAEIEAIMLEELDKAKECANVKNVRVLGAIGVLETYSPVDMARCQEEFVKRGVWVRPFGRLIYIMPQYIITDDQLVKLCRALVDVANIDSVFQCSHEVR